MNDKYTKHWALYLAGLDYNQKLTINGKGYYETINANLAFSAGEQWRNAPATDLPQPVFNIIDRVKWFKIASIASTNISVKFEPLKYKTDGSEDEGIIASEMATQEVKNVLDKFRLESKQRDLLADGFDTGDYACHIMFDPSKKLYNGQLGEYKGEIEIEIVDGQNVMFGNPNTNCTEKQPYIQLVGRDLVKNLQKEMKKYKDIITPDYDYTYMAGDNGLNEIQADGYGKALYVITYERKDDGLIYVSKCTSTAYIYKDVPTGLKRYPVIFQNYKTVKNSYHGRSEVSGIIPNQIAINKLFAMVIYHTMMSAFPTLVYDQKRINAWTNELGVPVGVKLEPGENIGNVVKYLETGNISQAVTGIIDLLMQYTKEMLGVSDAQLGAIDPKNTSAIIAVQKSGAVPLENIKARFYDFVEDMSLSVLDMISANYGIRPVVVDSGEERGIATYDFSKLKNIYLTTSTEVGSSGYYSEVATQTTLDNLLASQMITFIQYLERISDELIPNKQELIDELKGQMAQGSTEQYEQMMAFFQTLPPETQAQLQALPDEQFEQAVMELMGQGQQVLPQ